MGGWHVNSWQATGLRSVPLVRACAELCGIGVLSAWNLGEGCDVPEKAFIDEDEMPLNPLIAIKPRSLHSNHNKGKA